MKRFADDHADEDVNISQSFIGIGTIVYLLELPSFVSLSISKKNFKQMRRHLVDSASDV